VGEWDKSVELNVELL